MACTTHFKENIVKCIHDEGQMSGVGDVGQGLMSAGDVSTVIKHTMRERKKERKSIMYLMNACMVSTGLIKCSPFARGAFVRLMKTLLLFIRLAMTSSRVRTYTHRAPFPLAVERQKSRQERRVSVVSVVCIFRDKYK